MAVLGKDAILGAADLAREAVEVPEWGGTVCVREMTAAERDDFEAAVFADKGKDARANMKNFRARLAALTLVDADGNRLFGDDDAEALGKKSARALGRVAMAAMRLNGLTAGDVDELVKN